MVCNSRKRRCKIHENCMTAKKKTTHPLTRMKTIPYSKSMECFDNCNQHQTKPITQWNLKNGIKHETLKLKYLSNSLNLPSTIAGTFLKGLTAEGKSNKIKDERVYNTVFHENKNRQLTDYLGIREISADVWINRLWFPQNLFHSLCTKPYSNSRRRQQK